MTDVNEAHLERFFAYLDGELSDEERSAFEAELERDASLRAEFASFRATMEALHEAAHDEPAPDLTSGVQSRIRRRSRGRFFAAKNAPRFPLEMLVLLFALVVGGIALVTGTGPARLFDLPAPSPIDLPERAPDRAPADPRDPDGIPDAPANAPAEAVVPSSGERPPTALPDPVIDESGTLAPHVLHEEGQALLDELASTPRTSAPLGAPVAGARRIETDWVISTGLSLEALETLTRRRAGRQRTSVHDGRVVVEGDLVDVRPLVERFAELGPIERVRVPRDVPGLTRIWLLPEGVSFPSETE